MGRQDKNGPKNYAAPSTTEGQKKPIKMPVFTQALYCTL